MFFNKKNSKVLFFLFLISSFLTLGLIFTSSVSAIASYIPSGYRLLVAEDNGKVFGVDLEPNFYIDNTITPNLSSFNISLGAYFGSMDQIAIDSDSISFITWDYDEYPIYISGSWTSDYNYTQPFNLSPHDDGSYLPISISTGTFVNNWFYVKDIQTIPTPTGPIDTPQSSLPLSTSYLPSKIIYDYSSNTEPYDFSSSLYIPKFNLLSEYNGNVNYQCSLGQVGYYDYNVIFAAELSPNRLDYIYTNLNLLDSYLDIYYQDIILPVYEFHDSEYIYTSWDNYIPDLVIYKDSLTYQSLLYNIVYVDVELTGYNRETLESQVLTLTINVPQPGDTNFYSYYSIDSDSYTCFYLSRIIGDYVSTELYPQAEDDFIDLGIELNYISNLKIGLSNNGVSSSDDSYSFGFIYNFPTIYSLEDWISSDNMFNDFSPIRPIDMSDWLLTAVGSFMNAELFPGLAIGGIFAVLVAFPIAIWFLKIVLGG